jgi:Na+-translocating ferredoxin:NAD+ oxidoreductase RnfD subunit
VFGAFLLITGIKMWWFANEKPDLANNPLLKWLRGHMKISDELDGEKFFVWRDGVRYATPLFLALILVEFSDLIFAVDSIPAIFAVTNDPFIVLTSNVFAILGLRALFFALAGIIHMFHYLKYGLSIVLVVVGLKMLINGAFGPVIPTEWALLLTLGGLWLMQQRVFTWHVPVATLASCLIPGCLLWWFDPSAIVQPMAQLTSGGLLLGAFFIATDPVSGSTTPRGKLIFGAGAGLLAYIIRVFGGYPDGVAFAVLLMNLCVPVIDLLTQPRIFGMKDADKGGQA